MAILRKLLTFAAGAALCLPMLGNATIIYDDWVTNDGGSGNYIVTVDKNLTGFSVNITVNPWNAEALGLFVDLGDNDVGAVTLSNIVPLGEVSLFDTDTTSNNCGGGCNLNGLNPTLDSPDGEWEMVFRLGAQGFDSIQTFSFDVASIALAALNESDWSTVGVRAQQLCDGTDTLPDGSCGGSDKSAGNPGDTPVPPLEIPVPSTILLLGLGLLGLRFRAKA